MTSNYKVRHLTPLPSASVASEVKSVKVANPEIETLAHSTTCAKRNNHLHNSCIDMLKNGYHRAYTEIFNLVQDRKKARIEAGPGSEMSLEVILEENKNYIDKLKYHLCEAERGERSKLHEDVYTNISALAVFFDEEGVHWLAHHFYSRALGVAHNVRLDSGKSLSEASEKFGLAAEAIGDLEGAKGHLEASRRISKGRTSWKHANGETWHQQSSNHLSRVLRNLAAAQTDPAERSALLEKSVVAADESKDQLTIATAYYHFGCEQFNAKKFNDAQTSLAKALTSAVDIHNEKLVQLLTAKLSSLARVSSNSAESVAKAKEYLLLAVDQIKNEVESSVDALSQVALLYNAFGEFSLAEESIAEAYLASGQAGSREVSTRVTHGALSGNIHHPEFRRVLSRSTKDLGQVRRLVNWKDNGDNSLLHDQPKP